MPLADDYASDLDALIPINPLTGLIADDAEEGNTLEDSSSASTPLAPTVNRGQHRRWCFTLFVDENDDFDDQLNDIKDGLFTCVRYVFQLERCPTTQKRHFQGYCEFKNGRKFSGVKILLPNSTHWEVAKAKPEASYAYCTKNDSYLAGPWVKGFPMPVRSGIVVMRPWQQKVWDYVKTKPDDRKILWLYDYAGGTGKTALARHLCLNANALYVNGKADNVKCAVAAQVKEGKDVPIVIWGIPRSQEKYVSYAAIEEVKDGIFFSGKYESGQCIINPPHILVFSNFYPDTTQLSADRWVIYNVHNDEMPDTL